MRQNIDADLILTIAEQGFEGHLYDAKEKEKVVITFSGSEGGSAASDTMAYYYRQSGISALGVSLWVRGRILRLSEAAKIRRLFNL